MSLSRVEGNLVADAERYQYIAHQCNCLSNRASGIARAIFEKYPHSDVYAGRKHRDRPGTIKIMTKEGSPSVINMFAQYYPGGQRGYKNDSEQLRERWFAECLVRISKIPGIHEVAFPHGIGCGVAQGNWERYESMLRAFAKRNPNITTWVIKLSI